MAIGITNMTPSIVASDIEYLPYVIQRSGAYFNTKILDYDGIGVEFDFYTSIASTGFFAFGAYSSPVTTTYFTVVNSSAAKKFDVDYGDKNQTSISPINNQMTRISNNYLNNKKREINGVNVGDITKVRSKTGKQIWFGANSGSPGAFINGGGLGTLKLSLYESEYVQFLPCFQKSTGLVGFQNTKTGEITGSATSQPFIVPTQDAIDLIDMGVLPASLQNGQTEQKNELGVI